MASFGQVGNITCSFGVTCYKDKEVDDNFIKRADNALYKAKNEGRNRVVTIWVASTLEVDQTDPVFGNTFELGQLFCLCPLFIFVLLI